MPTRTLEGSLRKLHIQAADDAAEPVRYSLQVAGDNAQLDKLSLSGCLGYRVRIEFLGRIHCGNCGAVTRRSYGNGYCYTCFSTLARCDLCVMSPARCHYHEGTCREPEWGESFCMQPHIVYLANTSGLKVGITRVNNQQVRWMDQGAAQGLVILSAQTRRAAGMAEATIARVMSDRTDWRALVRSQALEIDLLAHRAALRDSKPMLPRGVDWLDTSPTNINYPVIRYPEQARQLKLSRENRLFEGKLIGLKGQYLLLSQGVFNVSSHSGFEVRISLSDEIEASDDNAELPSGDDEQLGLF